MNKYPIATLLGASGKIGRLLVRIMTKKNYRCIIPSRNPFSKGFLKTQAPPGAIEFIKFNQNNFNEIENAINNSDVVVNLCGILYETRKQKFFKIHSDLPESIAKICSRSNVKKFIHTSALGASAESKSKYQRSKFLGEEKSLESFDKTVIIRPSVVVSSDDEFTNLFGKLSTLPVIPVLNKNYNFQPIFANDVAKAIMMAIETKNNEGKIYELGGKKIMSFEDIIKLILQIVGKKRIILDMPVTLAKLQSIFLSVLPIPPILTLDQISILLEKDNVVSGNHLTLKDLDIKPTEIEKEMEKWLWRYRSGGEFAKV